MAAEALEAGEEDGCAECRKAHSPRYDFGKACCRARFLLSLPRPWIETRRAWLKHWEKQFGEAERQQTEAILLRLWKK